MEGQKARGRRFTRLLRHGLPNPRQIVRAADARIAAVEQSVLLPVRFTGAAGAVAHSQLHVQRAEQIHVVGRDVPAEEIPRPEGRFLAMFPRVGSEQCKCCFTIRDHFAAADDVDPQPVMSALFHRHGDRALLGRKGVHPCRDPVFLGVLVGRRHAAVRHGDSLDGGRNPVFVADIAQVEMERGRLRLGEHVPGFCALHHHRDRRAFERQSIDAHAARRSERANLKPVRVGQIDRHAEFLGDVEIEE